MLERLIYNNTPVNTAFWTPDALAWYYAPHCTLAWQLLPVPPLDPATSTLLLPATSLYSVTNSPAALHTTHNCSLAFLGHSLWQVTCQRSHQHPP